MIRRETLEGRCQCGQTKYRVVGETVAFFVCHCTECQHQSAGAFGMALWLERFSREVFGNELGEWVRSTPSGRRMVCEFCRRCGTRLFHRMSDQQDVMSIKPGTLDAALELEPVAQIWTSRAASWLRLPACSLSYPENPPSFEAIFAAWRARKEKARGGSRGA